jgi:hypothetical protein
MIAPPPAALALTALRPQHASLASGAGHPGYRLLERLAHHKAHAPPRGNDGCGPGLRGAADARPCAPALLSHPWLGVRACAHRGASPGQYPSLLRLACALPGRASRGQHLPPRHLRLPCRHRQSEPLRTAVPPTDHVDHRAMPRRGRAVGATKRVRLPAGRLVRPHAASGAAPTGSCRRRICGMAFTGRNSCIAWHLAHQSCPSRARRVVCRRQRRQAVHSHMARRGRVIVWCPPPRTVTRWGLPWAGRPPSVSGCSRVQLPPLQSGHTGVRVRPPGPRAGGSAAPSAPRAAAGPCASNTCGLSSAVSWRVLLPWHGTRFVRSWPLRRVWTRGLPRRHALGRLAAAVRRRLLGELALVRAQHRARHACTCPGRGLSRSDGPLPAGERGRVGRLGGVPSRGPAGGDRP